ncbi:hypothetical protein F4780DRAFT_779051 [Xylariomycetidae sp. FL0641]|nr:hypothetical protein F4780DRAFT_779051 [Xylariomycetidae sp. FL0641]
MTAAPPPSSRIPTPTLWRTLPFRAANRAAHHDIRLGTHRYSIYALASGAADGARGPRVAGGGDQRRAVYAAHLAARDREGVHPLFFIVAEEGPAAAARGEAEDGGEEEEEEEEKDAGGGGGDSWRGRSVLVVHLDTGAQEDGEAGGRPDRRGAEEEEQLEWDGPDPYEDDQARRREVGEEACKGTGEGEGS